MVAVFNVSAVVSQIEDLKVNQTNYLFDINKTPGTNFWVYFSPSTYYKPDLINIKVFYLFLVEKE